MKATDLRTEYLTAPRGMDEKEPRFSWRTIAGKHQTACELIVSDADSGECLWKSGIVPGAASSIPYQGHPLQPYRRYLWAVRLAGENGRWGRWNRACFETGLLGRPWPAAWITGPAAAGSPAPPFHFRREFHLPENPVCARLYLSSLGVYRPWCNGRKVTENTLMPGFTAYQGRVQYQVYDLTALLHAGANALAVEVAEGWYKGSINRHWNDGAVVWGEQCALTGFLRLDFTHAPAFELQTDADWLVTDRGPYRMSDIYQGEIYDARLCQAGWNEAGYSGEGWVRAQCLVPDVTGTGGKVNLVWNSGEPVRPIEERHPVAVNELEPGVFLCDFGQNLTGRERLRISAPRDTKIRIRHGEMLNSDGSLYTENLRGAQASSIVFADGKPFVYEPEFTFYGFRYIEISGWPEPLNPHDISVVVLHSVMRRTGYFSCSDPLLNQFYNNVIWSQRSNYLDIPSDCPQRDERMGWTGDAQVFIGTATYNFDVAAFFTKWLEDLSLSCRPNGVFPAVAPLYRNRLDFNSYADPGWSDAGLICPWTIYLFYGDKRILERHYPAMRRYVQTLTADAPELIRSRASYCDWLHLNAPTPPDLVCTAYFASSVALLAKIARILGEEQDAAELAALSERIRTAYQQRFFPDGEHLNIGTQTAALLSLHFDLVPDAAIGNTVDLLVDDIVRRHDTHLTTGFLGTPLLLEVLSRFGRLDVAYALLRQTTFPGWLYPVTQGATTIWERWDSWTPEQGFGTESMNSFNHYAYGAAASWFYRTIGGIRPLEEHPGFTRFELAPCPGGGLDSARAIFDAPPGRIESEWQYLSAQTIRYRFSIPSNSTALLRLPGRAVQELEPGTYHFTEAIVPPAPAQGCSRPGKSH